MDPPSVSFRLRSYTQQCYCNNAPKGALFVLMMSAKYTTGPEVTKILHKHKDQVLKLDIGCGDNKQQEDGWIGIDIQPLPGVDIFYDLQTFPWPLPDNTFTLLSASHVLEHITRENNIFIKFMDECWRVLKYDGQFRIAVPYAGSTMFWADPTHVNGIVPQTFHYFDPLAPLNTYHIYKPKPWKIEQLYWTQEGNVEALLSKRREDPSYGKR
jgi:SAM-dependent methyltransferase